MRQETFTNRALLALLASLVVACTPSESPKPTKVRITTWNLEWFPDGSAHDATPEVLHNASRQRQTFSGRLWLSLKFGMEDLFQGQTRFIGSGLQTILSFFFVRLPLFADFLFRVGQIPRVIFNRAVRNSNSSHD
jgi:hypothetical protein